MLEEIIEKNYQNTKEEGLDNMKEKWLLVSAQYNAGVPHKLMDGVEAYAKKFDYQIGIIPMAGAPRETRRELHERLTEHTIFEGSYKLNDSLEIHNWKVKPQKIKPLTGLRRFTKKNKSTIFGSTKQQIEHIATNKEMPKWIATTGAITKPHYNLDTEIGMKAKEMHEYGFLLIDIIDDTKFDWRNVIANKNGSFDDKYAHWDGKQLRKKRRPDAYIGGDSHYIVKDEGAHEKTLEDIKELKPKLFVDHDIGDFGCISHHTIGNSTAQYFARKNMTLDKELRIISDNMQEIYKALPKGAKYIVPQANHNEHLSKWLDEGRFLNDSMNINLVPELLGYRLAGQNPLEQILKNRYGLPKSIKFLTRNDDYKVRGIELARHGDLGSNGTRFSVNQAINNMGKVAIGHSHGAGKWEDVYMMGTRTKKRIGYNKGDSSWSHTNGILFPSGYIQFSNYNPYIKK